MNKPFSGFGFVIPIRIRAYPLSLTEVGFGYSRAPTRKHKKAQQCWAFIKRSLCFMRRKGDAKQWFRFCLGPLTRYQPVHQ